MSSFGGTERPGSSSPRKASPLGTWPSRLLRGGSGPATEPSSEPEGLEGAHWPAWCPVWRCRGDSLVSGSGDSQAPALSL
eukprot:7813736-Pyramimonas_sp.AAC.1